MTGLRVDAVHVLTWGIGGEGRTQVGLTLTEAQEWAADLSAWGPVIMRQWCGQLYYATSGRPVPDDNATAAYLRHLDAQRAEAVSAPQLAWARSYGVPTEREVAGMMADVPVNPLASP